ncbi:MAG: class I SAM-dependent methyltransferase [Steroidobacteraceae bacterium]
MPEASTLRATNRQFYDALWSAAHLIAPERLNTWPLVRSLLPQRGRRLEVAPGLRPRLPIEGTEFVDLSGPAVAKLAGRGARAVQSEISALPFASGAFDLVCALDILEHVDDDRGALAELRRVVAPGGVLLLSFPLHAARWTLFDELVGHRRRYEPEAIEGFLAEHGLRVARSAAYGMKPRSSRLVDHGMWWLDRHRRLAMWSYNRVLMPLGVLFQAPLALSAGLIDTHRVDEILLVCHTGAPTDPGAA